MLHENERTYYFPVEGSDKHSELHVGFVRELEVSKSGGHRITCASGLLVYVPSGWIGIEIDSDEGWEQ